MIAEILGAIGIGETLIKGILLYYIFGLSIQVVLRAGVFSLASAGTWMVSAYTVALLAGHMAWPLAVVAGVAFSAVIGGLLSLALRRLTGLYLGMATIALTLLLVSVAINWRDVTGGSLGLFGIPRPMSTDVMFLIVVVVTFAVALWQSGTAGRFLDVHRSDATLAETLGINLDHVWRSTFILSAAVGGVAGGLFPLIYGVIAPRSGGFALVVTGLTVAVIGGTASWTGAVIGALVVGLLPEVLRFGQEWRDVIYGVLVVLMIVVAPQGLLGLWRGAWYRLTGGRRFQPPSPATADDVVTQEVKA